MDPSQRQAVCVPRTCTPAGCTWDLSDSLKSLITRFLLRQTSRFFCHTAQAVEAKIHAQPCRQKVTLAPGVPRTQRGHGTLPPPLRPKYTHNCVDRKGLQRLVCHERKGGMEQRSDLHPITPTHKTCKTNNPKTGRRHTQEEDGVVLPPIQHTYV